MLLRAALGTRFGQRHAPDACGFSPLDIVVRVNAPVGGGFIGRMPEELAMMLDTRQPLVRLRRIAGEQSIVCDQAAVAFDIPDLTTVLCLMRTRFAAPDDGCVRFKQTDEFLAGRHAFAVEDAPRRLSDDLLDQRQIVRQTRRQGYSAQAAVGH